MIDRIAAGGNNGQSAVKPVSRAERAGKGQRLSVYVKYSVISARSDVELIVARGNLTRIAINERRIAGNICIHCSASIQRDAEVVYIETFMSVVLPLTFSQVVVLIRFITGNFARTPKVTCANARIAPLHTGCRHEARRRYNVINHMQLIVKAGVVTLIVNIAIKLNHCPNIVNLC